MRVAILIDHYHPGKGGLEVWLEGFSAYLTDNGHEAHLVSADREVPAPFEHHSVRAPGLTRARRDRAFAEGAREIALAGAFDVTLGLRHCLACDVYMPHGGSVAATFEGRSRPPGRVRNFLEIERELLTGDRPPARVIAISEMVRADLARRFPSMADRVRVVPNGVDLERFRPEGREEDRREFELGAGRAVLFLAGNPRLKGWVHARDVFVRLRDAGVAEHLLAAGGDPGRLPEGARYLGHTGRPERLLRAADLLLHPTLYDPFPLVVLEALACGTPVLTTERNGALDHVGRDGPVRAVPRPEDVEDAALLATDLLREAPRGAARERALAFPLSAAFASVLAVLREAIATRSQ